MADLGFLSWDGLSLFYDVTSFIRPAWASYLGHGRVPGGREGNPQSNLFSCSLISHTVGQITSCGQGQISWMKRKIFNLMKVMAKITFFFFFTPQAIFFFFNELA